MTSPTLEDQRSLGFPLVRGDLPFRLQRRLGLIPPDGLGLVRRALFWSMLGWLPVALWAWYVGRVLPGAAAEPLLAHFNIHARLLVAVPLMILAEGPANALTARLLPELVRSGLVPPATLLSYRGVLASTARLRDATLPWIVIVGVVVAFTTAAETAHRAHEVVWASEGAVAFGLGFGGLWYLYVGRTIFLALVLAWLWRIALLTVLFWRIARLELAIVPTHPDRTGGLGFLERLPTAFAPVVLAMGIAIASRWAHDAVYHDLTLRALHIEMIAFVIVCVLLFVLPLLALIGPLKRAKKQALLDYGALVGRQGRLVQQRWIEGQPLADEAVLNAPELGPVADTGALFDAVRSMRTVPIGRSAILPLAAAAAAPLLAVLAIQMPVKELLLKLLQAML